MATRRKGSSDRGKKKSITISIDLSALDKLYKKRYEVSLDGDTKGGSVKVHDGDTKRGVRIRDGDTKRGPAVPKPPKKKARPRRSK